MEDIILPNPFLFGGRMSYNDNNKLGQVILEV